MDATTLGIGLGVLGIILTILTVYWRNLFLDIYKYLKNIIRRSPIIEKGYYSHEFMIKNIRHAKRLVRIICVRNIRVVEPDIMNELRKFIEEKEGLIEIFALSPDVCDEIIAEIMVTLPNRPMSIGHFRDDFITNFGHIVKFYSDLGSKNQRFKYYEYNALPLIHLTQFDDDIFMGLQLYYKEEGKHSLLDYCINISAKSKLGKHIIDQAIHLRDNKAQELINLPRFKKALMNKHE